MLEAETILKHSLVPKHEIMSDTAVEKLLKQYNIARDQMPRITANDPIAKAIGAKKGQVLKITRDSITAGKAVTYRVVV